MVLTKADLGWARLVRTSVDGARFRSSAVYGASIWDLRGTPADQTDLVITPRSTHQLPSIRYGHDFERVSVDGLEVAQFMYLLLNNEHIRNVIDTVTSKVVLILGRFNEQQKNVLDAIRNALRKAALVPVLFDFQKPKNTDLTGTVELLARMAQFVIADLTDPSSIPHELATIIPFLRTTPVVPIRRAGSGGYGMFADFQRSYKWVLGTHEYRDRNSLLLELPQLINDVRHLSGELRSDSLSAK